MKKVEEMSIVMMRLVVSREVWKEVQESAQSMPMPDFLKKIQKQVEEAEEAVEDFAAFEAKYDEFLED